MPLLEPDSERWDWYKVRKAGSLAELRQYPAFILWNNGGGLRLAVPKGARPPESWSLGKRGEPRPWPAAPMTKEDFAKEKLLGALIASPVPVPEVEKNYGKFMRNYRRAQALGK